MQFIAKPKPSLPPYEMLKKECYLRLCPPSCPCDGLIPSHGPPPPLTFPIDKSQNNPTFSPLVIAIIGILASAFLLVSYYAIISKYCGNSSNSRQNREINNQEITMEEGFHGSFRHDPNQHEPWLITTPGLDEALIKTITLVKYKKGDGLVGSSDCSVCLGEFFDDDTLRLLPKCSHAFHVTCIDTWLRSHSNCPLCRANIISTFFNTNTNPSLMVDNHNDLIHSIINGGQDHNILLENQGESEEISSNEGGTQLGYGEETSGNTPKSTNTQVRALSDLGARIYGGRRASIRRSISMDHRVLNPNVLRYNHGEDCVVKIESLNKGDGVGNSSRRRRNELLHCVMNSVSMKRSFSSGRFLLRKHGRGRNEVIPL
ncbi:unnamed protein product [Amaranthus hypochondriacus]